MRRLYSVAPRPARGMRALAGRGDRVVSGCAQVHKDGGGVSYELDYQPQGPFYTQQALETHRVVSVNVGVVTSSVGLAAGPPASKGCHQQGARRWGRSVVL